MSAHYSSICPYFVLSLLMNTPKDECYRLENAMNFTEFTRKHLCPLIIAVVLLKPANLTDMGLTDDFSIHDFCLAALKTMMDRFSSGEPDGSTHPESVPQSRFSHVGSQVSARTGAARSQTPLSSQRCLFWIVTLFIPVNTGFACLIQFEVCLILIIYLGHSL